MPTALTLHLRLRAQLKSPVNEALEATSSPYKTLVAGYYPILTVLANTGNFQGFIQGIESKAHARLELYALGGFLLPQDGKPWWWKGSWSFNPQKSSISATLPHCMFQSPSLKSDAGSCCLDVSTVGFASVFGREYSFVFGNCLPTALQPQNFTFFLLWKAVMIMDVGRG